MSAKHAETILKKSHLAALPPPPVRIWPYPSPVTADVLYGRPLIQIKKNWEFRGSNTSVFINFKIEIIL